MKSKKYRKISLKNEKLLKVRKCLRLILELTIQDELKRFNHLETLYRQKFSKASELVQEFKRTRKGIYSQEELEKVRRKIYLKHILPSHQRRYDNIIKEERGLNELYRRSILRCSLSARCRSNIELRDEKENSLEEHPINLNMVWIPQSRDWICEKCFDYIGAHIPKESCIPDPGIYPSGF